MIDLIEAGALLALGFLAPGYLSFRLMNRIRGRSHEESDLRNNLTSIAFSAVLFTEFHFFICAPSLEATLIYAKEHWVKTTISILFLGVVTAVLSGLLLVRFVEPSIDRLKNRVVFKGHTTRPIDETLWISFMKTYDCQEIFVDTTDGLHYQGFLTGYSNESEEDALYLSPASRVSMDEKGEVVSEPIAIALFLPKGTIKRVLVLSNKKGVLNSRSESNSKKSPSQP